MQKGGSCMSQSQENQWGQFLSLKVPLWFHDFERNAFLAVSKLLDGTIEVEKLIPYNPNFPEEALYEWLILLGEMNQFSLEVDLVMERCLSDEIERKRSPGKNGGRGEKKGKNTNKTSAIFWKHVISILGMRRAKEYLPRTYNLAFNLYTTDYQFLYCVCEMEGVSLQLEAFEATLAS